MQMPWGDRDTSNAAELRLAAAVAEIEGLHTALLRSADPARRRRLLGQLAAAARRLADLAGTAPGLIPAQARGISRRQRRRAAITRGANWLLRATRDR
ncbi:putative anti-sigma-YlaC factor YlaD [Kitasatospora sp. MAP12-15]|uniref:hypothetical protein n=1 Tax=unclassified Kitasatospora TaxID=2633591 RepID=UPI002473ACC5|nr:hypothetical protein [Kitasatospora sp. MAP12-44]MDH6110418.1 putative anti-sigma-YlaC factor YlaD [Kitasatospora sp. MAP12-44]